MWEKILGVFSALPSFFGRKKAGTVSNPEQIETKTSKLSVPDVIRIGEMELTLEKPTFNVIYILIHHSDTKDTGSLSWDDIDRYHIEVNHWDFNGYHYGIELIGTEMKLLKGRPTNLKGSHCRNGRFNHKSIGFCVVGDWDKEKPPDQQIFLAKSFVRELQKKLGVSRDKVIGHNEAQEIAHVSRKKRKTCPGKMFNMDDFRKDLLVISKTIENNA